MRRLSFKDSKYMLNVELKTLFIGRSAYFMFTVECNNKSKEIDIIQNEQVVGIQFLKDQVLPPRIENDFLQFCIIV